VQANDTLQQLQLADHFTSEQTESSCSVRKLVFIIIFIIFDSSTGSVVDFCITSKSLYYGSVHLLSYSYWTVLYSLSLSLLIFIFRIRRCIETDFNVLTLVANIKHGRGILGIDRAHDFANDWRVGAPLASDLTR
jgi:hypothetical protein